MSEITIKIDFTQKTMGLSFGMTEERADELGELMASAFAEAVVKGKIVNAADIIETVVPIAKNDQELCFLIYFAGAQTDAIESMVRMQSSLGSLFGA